MKHHWRTFPLFLSSLFLVVLFMALSAFVEVPAAHAAPCSPAPRAERCFYITNVLNGGNEYDPVYSIIVGPGTGANLTKSWGAENSWGANAGIDAEGVSAQLNFSVTQSQSVSQQCTADINTTNQDKTLEWDSVYIDWYYDVYSYDFTTGQSTYTGTGWAKEYVAPKCNLY